MHGMCQEISVIIAAAQRNNGFRQLFYKISRSPHIANIRDSGKTFHIPGSGQLIICHSKADGRDSCGTQFI